MAACACWQRLPTSPRPSGRCGELPVDLLILDLQLKIGTGFGVLESIGNNRPTTVVMTNYALPQYRERARQLGVEHFLNKEKDFERLPEIVADIRAARCSRCRVSPAAHPAGSRQHDAACRWGCASRCSACRPRPPCGSASASGHANRSWCPSPPARRGHRPRFPA